MDVARKDLACGDTLGDDRNLRAYIPLFLDQVDGGCAVFACSASAFCLRIFHLEKMAGS